MAKTKHVIWSNLDLDLDDWRDDLLEEYPHVDADDEDALYRLMVDTNNDYLDDERCNLDIQLSQPILVIADLGLWHGRRMGYKEIESGNIRDCLYDPNEYVEWYVDGYGNMRSISIHHDGRNNCLFRAWKDGTTDTQRENLKDKLYRGVATPQDISRVTRSIGKEIGRVYGWN